METWSCFLIANRHPIITNLNVPGTPTVGKETKFRVSAWDPNGDAFIIYVDFGTAA